MKRLPSLLLAALLAAFTTTSFGLTAFQARPIAEKMLNDQARGKLIKIIGKRGYGAEPESWSYIFFDPYADQHGRWITVTGKSVTKITDGYSELEDFRFASYKEEEVIPKGALKVDSHQALAAVKKTAELKDIKISSASYQLSKKKGDVAPVWKIKLYADNGGSEVALGEAKVSAETGRVLEMEINRDKLN
jgi:hypothetical protein